MGAVAEAMLQRLENKITLDIRYSAPDKCARHLFGGKGCMGDGRRGLRNIEAVAIG